MTRNELDRFNTINYECTPLIEYMQANHPELVENMGGIQFARMIDLQEIPGKGTTCTIIFEHHEYWERLNRTMITNRQYIAFVPVKQIFDWLDTVNA